MNARSEPASLAPEFVIDAGSALHAMLCTTPAERIQALREARLDEPHRIDVTFNDGSFEIVFDDDDDDIEIEGVIPAPGTDVAELLDMWAVDTLANAVRDAIADQRAEADADRRIEAAEYARQWA